jgi:hypothetical protein
MKSMKVAFVLGKNMHCLWLEWFKWDNMYDQDSRNPKPTHLHLQVKRQGKWVVNMWIHSLIFFSALFLYFSTGAEQ